MAYPDHMRTPVAITLIVALGFGFVIATTLAVQRSSALAAQQEELEAAQAEIELLRAERDALEAELERAGGSGPISDTITLLDQLLTGDIDGALEGLLEGDGWLGGLLEGLLEDGGSIDTDGLLEGLLDGLGGLGGLDGLGEGVVERTAGASMRCLIPDDPTAVLGAGRGAPDDPQEVVDALVLSVAAERELDWLEDVEVAFLDGAAVAARLDDLLDAPGAIDRDALAFEQDLLIALRALEPGTDLEAVQRALLEDSVAGFYVPDTGELVVRVPDDGRIRGIDRITLAHELDHALTDQVLGLPDPDLPPLRGDSDAQLAALALVEGDATLLMQRWALSNVSLADQLSALGDADMVAAQAALDAAPHHVQRGLLFPYLDGMDWVCQQWLEGGWAAVDAAYADPPSTTAEILTGVAREPRDTPAVSDPPGTTSRGSTTFGAAPLSWLLEAPGGDPDRGLDAAIDRALVWAGGTAHLWDADDGVVAALALAEHRGSAAADGTTPGLCETLGDWFDAAAPSAEDVEVAVTRGWQDDRSAAVLDCREDAVVFVTAPALSGALAVVGAAG